MAKISVDFKLENPEDAALVFGTQDKYLTLLEHQLSVEINYRGEMVQILAADDASGQRARKAIQALQVLVRRGVPVHTSDVIIASQMVLDDDIENFTALYEVELTKDAVGKPIRLKNLVQKTYVDAVKHHDVVFGIGPAGTGKTFLAVVMAVQALRNGQVKRIILTRPAVEAGESLGFLPGDLQEKVDPYLRPVYDALYMILGKNATERMMERGIIEIAPLAYMRGRTLDDAFVILDEAQNTTTMQMKMFLTRLGFNSKMIVNGDISQIDLPSKVKSGLIDATEKLSRIQAIDFIYFTAKDVVRHPVVAEIINAYEKNSSGNCFKFQIEC
nr:PhoH family protein [Lactococcus fujiensis]